MKDPKDYIIFPLDVPTLDKAMSYVKRLKGRVGLFKVGLELFISQGPSVIGAVEEEGDARVFLDLKLHDIPATMQRALKVAGSHGPAFVTVHCDEGEGFLKGFFEARAGRPSTKVLAITVLTSLNPQKLYRLGYAPNVADDLSGLALLRAGLAKEAGCHGVVCSGHEAARIKGEFGTDFVVVTPGIRPSWSLVEGDDQKRVMTPADAVKTGADYVVIGRPIRDAADPAEAAQRTAEEIASAL